MKYILSFLLLLAGLSANSQLKWGSVERVYNDLITAISDGSKIAPPIKQSRSESRVAYYSPSKQTIFVEERFLQICSSFGTDSLNALAFILGHELAHFYRNHGWVSANGLGYVGAEMKNNWKEMSREEDNHAKDEAEADIFSGFYSLVAGYNALSTAGKTLVNIYEAYGINDTIPGYPTLQERVDISKRAMGKATHLYTIFNAGIYCLALNKFEVSSQIFTYIYNQDYAGAEILNNLAISKILGGYEAYGEIPTFYYPIFLSTETALDPNSRGAEGETQIREGIEYLELAVKKEPENAFFFLNIASAYTMLNQFIDAEYYLAKAINKNPDLQSKAGNLKGIIAMKKGDEKLAKKAWKSLKDDAFANGNYQMLFKGATFGASGTIQNEDSESALPLVDEIDLSDPRLKSKLDFKKVRLPQLRISYTQLTSSTVIQIYGGSAIDYTFQVFNAEELKEVESSWNEIISSPSTTISKSNELNLLQIKNSGKKAPELVKFIVN